MKKMFKNFEFNTFSKWNYLWLWMFPAIIGIDKGAGDDKTVKAYFKKVGNKLYLTNVEEIKVNKKVYVRNWRCKKHNTFGDDPFIPCAHCHYSGRGRIRVFESLDDYKKYLRGKK